MSIVYLGEEVQPKAIPLLDYYYTTYYLLVVDYYYTTYYLLVVDYYYTTYYLLKEKR